MFSSFFMLKVDYKKNALLVFAIFAIHIFLFLTPY